MSNRQPVSTPTSQQHQPAAPVFINFWNRETFCFYTWVSEGGHVDPQALIDEAFRKANAEPIPEGLNVWDVAAEHLAERLDGLLGDLRIEVDIADDIEIGDICDPSGELWKAMLVSSLAKIDDLGLVADALLARAGKLPPSNESPAELCPAVAQA